MRASMYTHGRPRCGVTHTQVCARGPLSACKARFYVRSNAEPTGFIRKSQSSYIHASHSGKRRAAPSRLDTEIHIYSDTRSITILYCAIYLYDLCDLYIYIYIYIYINLNYPNNDFDGLSKYYSIIIVYLSYLNILMLMINAHTISCAIIIAASFTACQLFLTLP